MEYNLYFASSPFVTSFASYLRLLVLLSEIVKRYQQKRYFSDNLE